jgi:pSer/pThr/pTyr-binding forkhead associated (FHA) protein
LIICPKCTKENQDHYKFCLGCGAELPRDTAPKKAVSGTPPHGVRAVAVEPQAAAPAPAVPAPSASSPVSAAPPPDPGPAPADDGASVPCPQCEHPNPSTNKFCASCGFKMSKAASVPAPAGGGVAGGMVQSASSPAPHASSGVAAATGAEAAAFVSGGGQVLLTALRADGTEAGSFMIAGPTGVIGRDSGGIFAGDSYLSPRHATFFNRGGAWMVRDESSLNGVYRKLQREEPIELGFGDIFRIGQEILRVEPLTPPAKAADGVERMGSPSKGFIGRLALVIGRDATGNAYPVPEAGLHLGRERGDVLFPEDGYVSGLHCRIAWQNGKLWLTDLGSSNGSFARLQKETALTNGDVLLMGQQLFRVSL